MKTLKIYHFNRYFRNTGTWMLLLLLTGCSENSISTETEQTETEQVQPGAFSITHIQSASKANDVASRNATGQDAAAFDLGEVNNTTDFFFVLTNAGDTDINDITIEMDHPGFQLSPKKIGALPPLEQLAMNQVLKLTIVHGSAPSGVGNAPLLEPGNTSSEVLIKGTTTNANGDSLEIELEVDVTVNIKLTDIRFYRSGGSEINLESSSGTIRNSRLYSGALPKNSVAAGDITVENTGNVDVTITTYGYFYPAYEQFHSFQLSGGASRTLQWPEFELSDLEVFVMSEHIRVASTFNFKIAIGNTITDHNRLPIQDDGNVYIVLSRH